MVSARFVKVCGVWRDIKYRRQLKARMITYFTCSGSFSLLRVLEVLYLLVLVDCCLLVKIRSSKYERKKRENPSEIEKNLMKMRCCVTPCGQTDVGSSQKTFLAFSRASKRRHRSKLSTKKVFFFGFIQRKISLSGDNIFSLAMLSAIIYHKRSN